MLTFFQAQAHDLGEVGQGAPSARVGMLESIPVGDVGGFARIASIVPGLNIGCQKCSIGCALNNARHVVTQGAQGHVGNAVDRNQLFLTTIDAQLVE
ncbi:hypothetical protein D3C78_1478710 [compost metagenome]